MLNWTRRQKHHRPKCSVEVEVLILKAALRSWTIDETRRLLKALNHTASLLVITNDVDGHFFHGLVDAVSIGEFWKHPHIARQYHTRLLVLMRCDEACDEGLLSISQSSQYGRAAYHCLIDVALFQVYSASVGVTQQVVRCIEKQCLCPVRLFETRSVPRSVHFGEVAKDCYSFKYKKVRSVQVIMDWTLLFHFHRGVPHFWRKLKALNIQTTKACHPFILDGRVECCAPTVETFAVFRPDGLTYFDIVLPYSASLNVLQMGSRLSRIRLRRGSSGRSQANGTHASLYNLNWSFKNPHGRSCRHVRSAGGDQATYYEVSRNTPDGYLRYFPTVRLYGVPMGKFGLTLTHTKSLVWHRLAPKDRGRGYIPVTRASVLNSQGLRRLAIFTPLRKKMNDQMDVGLFMPTRLNDLVLVAMDGSDDVWRLEYIISCEELESIHSAEILRLVGEQSRDQKDPSIINFSNFGIIASKIYIKMAFRLVDL